MKRAIAFATLVFLVIVLGALIAPSNSEAGQKPSFVDKGHKLFDQYCATCHGLTAKGEGPVAAALKVGPPDLTAIQQPGEKFPFYRVQTRIDGEKEVAAHGTSKMPVWGPVLRRTSGEMQRHADLYSLVKYIESIQRVK